MVNITQIALHLNVLLTQVSGRMLSSRNFREMVKIDDFIEMRAEMQRSQVIRQNNLHELL